MHGEVGHDKYSRVSGAQGGKLLDEVRARVAFRPHQKESGARGMGWGRLFCRRIEVSGSGKANI